MTISDDHKLLTLSQAELVQGPAATIEVGTVTTGDPGTEVVVTNSGDENAAVFDFTIPKGEDGTGLGDVVGPSSAVDSRLAAFDTTTGKLLKDSGKAVADFATAAQGTKADSALQSTDTGTGSGKIPVLNANGQIAAAQTVANVTRLVWNGTAYPSRPTGVGYVQYVGPTANAPTGMAAGDTWLKT